MATDAYGRFVPAASGVPLLHPAEQTFEDMLAGWRNQQLSRNLSVSTIDGREQVVRRFTTHANAYPWTWTMQHVDDFFADRRAVHHNARTTVRSYQNALSVFGDYLCDPGYGWIERCFALFGTHPTRVLSDWNTARHVQEIEHGGRLRPFTRNEIQALFDRADDEAERIARTTRKGWHAAFRDATVMKTAYLFGLRVNEVRHLQTVDFTKNRYAPEFGRFGHLNVRFGKSLKGSDYKQRNVLAVWTWGTEILQDWVDRSRQFRVNTLDLFPTERGTIISNSALNTRFRQFRADIGLDADVTFHSLRRSYITHLIEDGAESLFVQQQVGHEYASTTALYTGVSSDYRTRTLRTMLESTLRDALHRRQAGS